MAIAPEQIGTGINLDEAEREIADGIDEKIEEKLLVAEKGKRRYKIDIVAKNELSDKVITAIKNRYHDKNWKEVLIVKVPDGPFTYAVQLDV